LERGTSVPWHVLSRGLPLITYAEDWIGLERPSVARLEWIVVLSMAITPGEIRRRVDVVRALPSLVLSKDMTGANGLDVAWIRRG